MKKSHYIIASVCLLAVSCSGVADLSGDKPGGTDTSVVDETPADISESSSTDDSSDLISSTSFGRTITVTWSEAGAAKSGDDGNLVTIDGGRVTVNNTGSEIIKYVLTGKSSDGFFKVYGAKKQAFVLKDLDLTNPKGAAINNQNKKRTFVVLEGVNRLADGSDYETVGSEDQKAAFFSEAQLIFSGDGSLTVNAVGKSGIASDDYIRFLGKQTVNVSSSAGHGIRGKDYILVDDGTINVAVSADMKKGFSSDSLVRVTGGVSTIDVTGGSAFDEEDQDYSSSAGIKADKAFEMTGGSLKITNSGKGGKGIRVGSSSVMGKLGTSYVTGGTIDITTTGAKYPYTLNGTSDSKSPKGIKIGWAVKKNDHVFSDFSGDLVVTGGKITVRSTNAEAIEVKKTLTVKGGEIYGWSQVEDAINTASTFTIEDGFVCGISLGNDGLDANGNFYIKGGVVFASGKSSPELAIDANTEGGFKLYVSGGTIFALGGLESGASLSQSCYQASSWSKQTWYSLTVGDVSYAFLTPSSGGSPLVVSGATTPVVKSGVSVSGGEALFDGNAVAGGSISGGNSVSLSAYTASGGGPGGPGGGGRR